MGYITRCFGYLRQRGIRVDADHALIPYLTPAQRRRASKKERQTWRRNADKELYSDG